MATSRFELALEKLQPDDWKIFEEFASKFLAEDFPELRSMGTPEGDKGRDAELFSPTDEPSVFIQYSVTDNWQAKVRRTGERIRVNFPDASILIYATNQVIGARADSLRKELRRLHNLQLDVRDRTWFQDRELSSDGRRKVVEDLARKIVDPFLASIDITRNVGPSLTERETKAAVLHLELQFADDQRDRGLTRLCYEALIKAALRDTTSEKRLARSELIRRIQAVLPNQIEGTVATQVNVACERLSKNVVKHYVKGDEFCLSHEEHIKVQGQLIERERLYAELTAEVSKVVRDVSSFDDLPKAHEEDLVERAKRVVDAFLWRQGESFASQVVQGRAILEVSNVKDFVAKDYTNFPDRLKIGAEGVRCVEASAMELLRSPPEVVQHYLRRVADSYTLFGFLKVAPDVQAVVKKVFAYGTLWLDTSIILPLMVESLLLPEERRLTPLIRAARDAGLRLRVTSGVVEEVERHLNRCLSYNSKTAGQWNGGVPFVYLIYSLSGTYDGSFSSWVETICGRERAEDDVVEYLLEEWAIEAESLEEEEARLAPAIRLPIQEFWRGVHGVRRKQDQDWDGLAIDRLARHDSETVAGILYRRQQSPTDSLGYRDWWITLDQAAIRMSGDFWKTLPANTPKSPVMSPDFLANYLAVGPVRMQVTKERESRIPVSMIDMLPEELPSPLLVLAQEVRNECADAPPRVVRRRLRDTLDRVRGRGGQWSHEGLEGLKGALIKQINSRMKKA